MFGMGKNRVIINGVDVTNSGSTDISSKNVINVYLGSPENPGELVNVVDVNMGDVTINGNAGPVKTNMGNVTVKGDVSGDATTKQGDISCSDVSGDAKSSMGNITASQIFGKAKTSMGDIKFR